MSIVFQSGIMLWLLVVTGFAAIFIYIERFLYLRRVQIDYVDFLKGVCNVLDKDNIDEAMMICDDTPCPVGTVTATAIRHRAGSEKALREAVDMAGRAEVSRLARRVAALGVICQTAPLLGLTGTLIGFVRIVLAMNEQAPVIQSADLMSGLMQSLVCAIAGLVIAILAHVMHALLLVRIERIVQEMEAAASEIIAYITTGASIGEDVAE